jgi:hypothetical protein
MNNYYFLLFLFLAYAYYHFYMVWNRSNKSWHICLMMVLTGKMLVFTIDYVSSVIFITSFYMLKKFIIILKLMNKSMLIIIKHYFFIC